MSRRRRIAIMTGGALAFSAAIGGYLASPALAYTGNLGNTPCSTSARACVDLDDQKMWLAKDGKVTGGPYRISSGGHGKETPLGKFRVYSKDKDHKSRDFPLPNGQPAPMPYSVFFAPGGVALHGGDPKRASAGCVHVPPGEAATVFNSLNVGDEVQVVNSSDNKKGGFYGVNNLKNPADAKKDDDKKKKKDDKKKDKKKD